MIFLRFGAELINLSQVYQIDLKEADGGIVIAFFYHLAGSTSGGYKLSRVFKNADEALNELVSYGIQIKPVEIKEEYYDASQVPTGRVNTRIEPTRRRK
jgi:hypothetical protein